VESTLSKREPRVKLWKGSHVGAVWGWEPYSGDMARRSSIVVVSPEPMPHKIGQNHCSPAIGTRQETSVRSLNSGSKYPNAFWCLAVKI
jgi:hypothetical protein